MTRTFTASLAEFADKTGADIEDVVGKATTDLFASIVHRSPVGLPELWAENRERAARGLPPRKPAGYVGGRLRASWTIGIGAPATNNAPPDKAGEATIARGVAALSAWQPGQNIYISTRMPYAPRIEFEAWSTQAPAGMVSISVAEWTGFVEGAARAKRD